MEDMKKIHVNPTKRHEFVYLFDVEMGNPNGDPDAGNLPRMDPQNMKGIVTDVCLKRKIRDYIQMTQNKGGFEVFIQNETALNTLIENAAKEKVGFEPPKAKIDDDIVEWFQDNPPDPDEFGLDGNILTYLGEAFKNNKVKKELSKDIDDTKLKNKVEAIVKALGKAAKEKLTPEKRCKTREELIRKYYDIRLFGAVLTTGINAGQVRGPMQITFSQSIDPIFPMDVGITRVAITKQEDKRKKETEMGRKPLIPYGLYRAYGFYNPYLGSSEKGTGVSEKDLEIFWDALLNMYELNRTSSKGLMSCRGLYIFSHDNKTGKAPAHRLFEMLKIKSHGTEPARSFSDYEIAIDRENVPAGVTLEEKI